MQKFGVSKHQPQLSTKADISSFGYSSGQVSQLLIVVAWKYHSKSISRQFLQC